MSAAEKMDTAAMDEMIKNAEEKGYWLYSPYAEVLFSPDELRAEQANGRFRWGQTNWDSVSPDEHLRFLVEKEKRATEKLEAFQARVDAWRATRKPSP